MSDLPAAEVRHLWRTTEPYHAVAYFAPEVVEAEARHRYVPPSPRAG